MNKRATCVIATLLSSVSQITTAAVFSNQSNLSSWHNLYILAQAGWQKTEESSLNTTAINYLNTLGSPASTLQSYSKTTGAAGRIALGYNLVPHYLDLQLGYTKYQGTYQNTTINLGVAQPLVINFQTTLQTVDLALEGKLPLNQFYLAGKAGLAYVHFTEAAFDNANSFGISTLPTSIHETINKFRPLVGAGLGYIATEHVFVEASYQNIFGNGNTFLSNTPTPNIQFVSLGVGYHF